VAIAIKARKLDTVKDLLEKGFKRPPWDVSQAYNGFQIHPHVTQNYLYLLG